MAMFLMPPLGGGPACRCSEKEDSVSTEAEEMGRFLDENYHQGLIDRQLHSEPVVAVLCHAPGLEVLV